MSQCIHKKETHLTTCIPLYFFGILNLPYRQTVINSFSCSFCPFIAFILFMLDVVICTIYLLIVVRCYFSFSCVYSQTNYSIYHKLFDTDLSMFTCFSRSVPDSKTCSVFSSLQFLTASDLKLWFPNSGPRTSRGPERGSWKSSTKWQF